MDDNYQTYLNRVARMMLPESYKSQVQHIQESPKFQLCPEGGFQAVPFPGWTTITPPGQEDVENLAFYSHLKDCQAQLLELLGANVLIPVPASSFHLTLADLIWDSTYRDITEENPNFDQQLRDAMAQIFQQSQALVSGGIPLRWQLLGLIVMPRALGISLLPVEESSYDRTSKFRRTIYQNSNLMALGVEQQYHFTAHITLGYFGQVSSNLDRDELSSSLYEFNQRWLENPPELVVKRAELRKFDDMTHYYRQPDWPALEF